jgi:putative phosphoesterase
MTLRIVIISDIHSNLIAFETVLGNLPEHDQLFCLGDMVGYGPQPNEVIELLKQLDPNVVLMGNHDYAVATGDTSGFSPHAAVAVDWTRRQMKLESSNYLSDLHASALLEVEGVSLGLFHGSPSDPLTEYIFPGIPEHAAKKMIRKAGVKGILLGHTHMPMLYSFEGEMLGNPGSVGQPRDGDPRASFGMLTISEGKMSFDIKRVEYDIDSVADKIRRAGLPEFLAERLYIGM